MLLICNILALREGTMSPTKNDGSKRSTVIETPQDLALLVRARRHELGLSQEALAYATGLDRTIVSVLERGERAMTLKVALRLVQALGMDIVVRRRAR